MSAALRLSDLQLPQPYLLFLGDVTEAPYAKTAFGLQDWVPERCVELFGSNVTDERAVVGTFFRNTTVVETLLRPREIGVGLRYSFR